jgi:hypothetical protein
MQVAILRVNLYIGIAKDSNLNNLSNLHEDSFSIFESIEDAIKYAEVFIEEYDFIECFIYNNTKDIIKHIQPK